MAAPGEQTKSSLSPPSPAPPSSHRKQSKRKRNSKPNYNEDGNGAANGDDGGASSSTHPENERKESMKRKPKKVKDGPTYQASPWEWMHLPVLAHRVRHTVAKYGGVHIIPPKGCIHPNLRINEHSRFTPREQIMPAEPWIDAKRGKAKLKVKDPAIFTEGEIITAGEYLKEGEEKMKELGFKRVGAKFGCGITAKNKKQYARMMHNERRMAILMAKGNNGEQVRLQYGIDVEAEGVYDHRAQNYSLNGPGWTVGDRKMLDINEDNDESNQSAQNEIKSKKAQNESVQNIQNRDEMKAPPTNIGGSVAENTDGGTNLPPQPSARQVQTSLIIPTQLPNPDDHEMPVRTSLYPTPVSATAYPNPDGFSSEDLMTMNVGSGVNGFLTSLPLKNSQNLNRGSRRIGVTPAPGQPMEIDGAEVRMPGTNNTRPQLETLPASSVFPNGVSFEEETIDEGGPDDGVVGYEPTPAATELNKRKREESKEDADDAEDDDEAEEIPRFFDGVHNERIGNAVSHVGNINDYGLLRHSPASPGINKSMYYIGYAGTKFCQHTEDSFLNSMSYLHEKSAPKSWYTNPASQRHLVEEYAAKQVFSKNLLDKNDGDANRLLAAKSTYLNMHGLAGSGVDVYRFVQTPGTLIMTAPGGYHGGFNHGNNIAEAVNYADSNWLSYGKEAHELYSLQKKESVVSYEWSLFQEVNSIWKGVRDKGGPQEYLDSMKRPELGEDAEAMEAFRKSLVHTANLTVEHLLKFVDQEAVIKHLVMEKGWRVNETAILEEHFELPVLHPSLGNGAGIECTECKAKSHFYTVICGSCDEKKEALCFEHRDMKLCEHEDHRRTILRRHNPHHLLHILETVEDVAGISISANEYMRRRKQIVTNEMVPSKKDPGLRLKMCLSEAPITEAHPLKLPLFSNNDEYTKEMHNSAHQTIIAYVDDLPRADQNIVDKLGKVRVEKMAKDMELEKKRKADEESSHEEFKPSTKKKKARKSSSAKAKPLEGGGPSCEIEAARSKKGANTQKKKKDVDEDDDSRSGPSATNGRRSRSRKLSRKLQEAQQDEEVSKSMTVNTDKKTSRRRKKRRLEDPVEVGGSDKQEAEQSEMDMGNRSENHSVLIAKNESISTPRAAEENSTVRDEDKDTVGPSSGESSEEDEVMTADNSEKVVDAEQSVPNRLDPLTIRAKTRRRGIPKKRKAEEAKTLVSSRHKSRKISEERQPERPEDDIAVAEPMDVDPKSQEEPEDEDDSPDALVEESAAEARVEDASAQVGKNEKAERTEDEVQSAEAKSPAEDESGSAKKSLEKETDTALGNERPNGGENPIVPSSLNKEGDDSVIGATADGVTLSVPLNQEVDGSVPPLALKTTSDAEAVADDDGKTTAPHGATASTPDVGITGSNGDVEAQKVTAPSLPAMPLQLSKPLGEITAGKPNAATQAPEVKGSAALVTEADKGAEKEGAASSEKALMNGAVATNIEAEGDKKEEAVES